MLGNNKAKAAAASIYVTGSFWFAGAAMAAGIETLRLIREGNYLEQIEGLGARLRDGLAERAAASGFGFRQTGPVTMPLFLFDDDKDLAKGFAWCAAMLERGVLRSPLAQHVPLRRHDRGGHRLRAGRRRKRVRKPEARHADAETRRQDGLPHRRLNATRFEARFSHSPGPDLLRLLVADRVVGVLVVLFGQEARRLQRRHAAHARRRHRLAIDVVGHVAAGVDTLDLGGGRAGARPSDNRKHGCAADP